MPYRPRLPAADTIVWAAASLALGAAALFLAANHPLWPLAAVAALAAWILVAGRFPAAWLFVLPACLPALNLSPWTGWIGIEELDLLVLGTAAAGYAGLARQTAPRAPPLSALGRSVVAVVATLTVWGLWRGVADAGGVGLGWFQGYTEPLNSWRIAKSTIHALLLLPLLRRVWFTDAALAARRVAAGMLAGAAVVTLAVLWERAAHPGLLDVLTPYRTTALFWEMHVGGAAIDAYVVLCTPFVAWAVWAARTRWQWAAAALFAALWAYTCLTTFSRGVYVGAAVALLVLGTALPAARGPRGWPVARAVLFVLGAAVLLAVVLESWGYVAAVLALVALAAALWLRWRGAADRKHRGLATALLALALVFEAVVVAGPESFMGMRVASSPRDYESRVAHWLRGVRLLQDADAWLWGLGLGRLPAHYDRAAPRGEFSGAVAWQQGEGTQAGHVRIDGPRTRRSLGGLYGLTQRVPLAPAYRLHLDVRSSRPAAVLVRVCESHLLYDRACQLAVVRVKPADGAAWQRLEVALRGPPLDAGGWSGLRQGVLTLSVLNAGASVELDNLALASAGGAQGLRNGDFSAGMAHWLPAAQVHFLPWHIDNLYLELLIERGAVGLLGFLALVGAVGWRLLRRVGSADAGSAPVLLASLGGLLALGLVSSVLDVPRVAMLASLLVVIGTLPVRTCLLLTMPNNCARVITK
jgi:hypothetical protein